MTSHWPTFADGLFWCACDNRTFTSQDEWQLHVLRAMVEEHRRIRDALAAIPDEPPSLFRNLWTGSDCDWQRSFTSGGTSVRCSLPKDHVGDHSYPDQPSETADELPHRGP